MAAPTLITELSQTAGSNGPAGSVSPIELDNYDRAHASFIAQLRDGKGHAATASVASATTTDIGAANSLSVEITGTTTIAGFGTAYSGPRFLRFAGALTLTNSASLALPGAANITTAAGDTCIAVPNLAANGWNVTAYTQAVGSGVPAGTVIDYAANAAPLGYLKANGAAVSRTTYAALFTAIGTTFGVGDGSTTFNVPDLRGEFVRGWDDSRGVDSARVFGSAQSDLLRDHTHNYSAPSISAAMTGGASNTVLTATTTATGNPNGGLGGAETRPRNIALLKCIKY